LFVDALINPTDPAEAMPSFTSREMSWEKE
jgi:hypothetical protein